MAGSDARKLLAEIREASQLLQKGRRAEALVIYRDVRQRAERLDRVQFELGNLNREIGDIDQAVVHYAIAAEEAPDNPEYLYMLGRAYLNAGETENARSTLERALTINPDNASAQHGLGICYMRVADYERAVGHLERACALKPSDAGVRISLCTTLAQLNRHEEALNHGRKAVSLDESDPDTHLALCETLAQVGDIDAAVKHLDKTIRRQPKSGFAYDLLARIRKFSTEDEPFIRRAEKTLARGMPPTERFSLHFALGKMHDDCSYYDEAFAHYEKGNRLQKKAYDLRNDERLLKIMKKTFTASSLEAMRPLGNPSAQPVFIVGMPRSGTTLMERIISSHPKATGAGELREIARLTEEVLPESNQHSVIARIKPELTAEKIAEYANRYLNVLQQGHPDAERIVDKMPSNFFYVGVIKTLFPNATIINAIRHPLDACLSCFVQNFARLRWANDFQSIARVYTLYRKSMDYWKEVLPEGSILDVRYEQLVEDPETQARRMLEACGLEWDPGVLEFFKKKGVVQTASIAQARQPIYRSSRMRWMNYARHLEPLAAAIAPYLENDRALLSEHGIELPATTGWLKRILK